jgi:hypothetical protein
MYTATFYSLLVLIVLVTYFLFRSRVYKVELLHQHLNVFQSSIVKMKLFGTHTLSTLDRNEIEMVLDDTTLSTGVTKHKRLKITVGDKILFILVDGRDGWDDEMLLLLYEQFNNLSTDKDDDSL